MQVERRVIEIAELRAEPGGKHIEGYAARYNILSGRMPVGMKRNGKLKWIRERIAPGAFRDAVASKQDVVMLVQHDNDKVLGRTTAGTLQLGEDSKGLSFRCSMPDTQLGRDTYESIKRGDMNGCSFAFIPGVDDSTYEEEEDREKPADGIPDDLEDDELDDERSAGAKPRKRVIRTFHKIQSLRDVSVVTRPAYPTGTSVTARKFDFEERAIVLPEEVMQRFFPEPPTQAASDDARARRRNLINTILS